ncbi:MAG: class I SAM-dependent methyltransferase [Gemmatimonadota bacterium]|jgi:ubiquinone/menaquinone biosynthesis C-methylase UbiE
MDEHTCPWWFGYTFDNPIRSILHAPCQVVGKYVEKGDTVADIGCGGGHFTLGLAELVGSEGKVLALDVQEKMLRRVRRRGQRQGLEAVIDPRLCNPDSLGLDGPLDFALAFWMVHEVPDQRAFFSEVRSALKPSGGFLVAEPLLHVTAGRFRETVEVAREVGFEVGAEPRIRFSRAVLLSPSGNLRT